MNTIKVPVKIKGTNAPITLNIRPNTTDEKVIKEVLVTDVYEKKSINFFVESTDEWLDLGGNIGTFSLLCAARGAKSYSYEPEPENYNLMVENLKNQKGIKTYQQAVGTNTGTIDLYICKGDYNKYRHTVYPKRGRTKVSVPILSIYDVLNKHKKINAIKIDAEGIEIDILELLKPEDYAKYGIKKMVFEYSFDIDKSIPRFMAIMHKLQKYFSLVHWTKVKEDELEYNYFPAATLVFCSL